MPNLSPASPPESGRTLLLSDLRTVGHEGQDAATWLGDHISLEQSPTDPADQIVGVLARHQYMSLRNVLSYTDFDTPCRRRRHRGRACPHLRTLGDEIIARELHMRLIGIAAWFTMVSLR